MVTPDDCKKAARGAPSNQRETFSDRVVKKVAERYKKAWKVEEAFGDKDGAWLALTAK